MTTEMNDRRIFRFSQIALGKDPDSHQSINNFMKMDSVIERTNLPTTVDCQRIDYLLYAGGTYWPDVDNDPFTRAAESEAITYMPRGGEKAKQVVELMRTTPNITDLKTSLAEQKPSALNRLLGRKEE